jgi:hypothetical protein
MTASAVSGEGEANNSRQRLRRYFFIFLTLLSWRESPPSSSLRVISWLAIALHPLLSRPCPSGSIGTIGLSEVPGTDGLVRTGIRGPVIHRAVPVGVALENLGCNKIIAGKTRRFPLRPCGRFGLLGSAFSLLGTISAPNGHVVKL